MIIAGSQIILCDLPCRLDTYTGCTHGCKYCFAPKREGTRKEFTNVRKESCTKSLYDHIVNKKRNAATNWCDWDIPIHWGGMSDPFQPIEKKYKESYNCLKIFAETGYPFVVSTKGVMIVEEEYLDLLKASNGAVQISMASSKYDEMESGTGGYQKRFDILKKLSTNSKRLIIRVQPYIREVKDDILANIKKWSEQGVYGVAFEGIKFSKKVKGFVKKGTEFLYPADLLKKDFVEFREACHENGMQFLSAENRLRYMGDSLCCCGVEGLEGFRTNKANLNHFLFDKSGVEWTDKMKEEKNQIVFQVLMQTKAGTEYLKHRTYKDVMEDIFADGQVIRNIYGEK